MGREVDGEARPGARLRRGTLTVVEEEADEGMAEEEEAVLGAAPVVEHGWKFTGEGCEGYAKDAEEEAQDQA